MCTPSSSPLSGASPSRSPKRGYVLIVAMFLSFLSVALATSWGAVELVNTARAFATVEGLYSKASKSAALDLTRYAYSQKPSDYDAFRKDIAVPLGDRAARLALTRKPVDLRAAAEGFRRGQNHPDDIDGMIRLLRWFSWWQPLVAASEDWRKADEHVLALVAEGERLHDAIANGSFDSRTRNALLARIESRDALLSRREYAFSAQVGDVARRATTLAVLTRVGLTVVLWVIGILVALHLLRSQAALSRQLMASERRFRDYAEVASDWYWEMDRNNRIRYMSERIHDIVTVPAGTAIDFDGVKMIQESADDPRQRDECLKAIEERRPFRGVRLKFIAKDGSSGYGTISGKPNFDSDGAFLGYRGIGADVTAEAMHARALKGAKARADAANRAKSEFLANMSHELRTPLNAILGFSDVIAGRMFGDTVPERYCEYARDIHESGVHLLSIINDILDLSKIEAGHTMLEEREVPLEHILAETRRLLGDRGKDVALHIDVADPSVMLRLDDRKFVQILVNLLSNAFKFTPAGGSVTLSAGVCPDGSFAVTVRDTGIGIAEADLEKVLSPFGQVESAFSRNHQGTGLGLPLAKSLAELHGGTLALESVVDHGTAVTVTLPAERVVLSAPVGSARAQAQ
ncbi:MAG: PAS domain S-box protein [Proteobacteria bacterium]|nr:PAS domain S-box protein [Pseudomonadota bacterium]